MRSLRTVAIGAIASLALAASAAAQTKPLHGRDSTGRPTEVLDVWDQSGLPFLGERPLTVGTPDAVGAGRSLKATCTGAGNVAVTYVDGSQGVWAVVIGVQTLPVAVTTVRTAGTTAACTYANLV